MQESNSTSPAQDRGNPASLWDQADQVPFFLRTWWLRSYAINSEIPWSADASLTLPYWSMYSDPHCDVGSMDCDLP